MKTSWGRIILWNAIELCSLTKYPLWEECGSQIKLFHCWPLLNTSPIFHLVLCGKIFTLLGKYLRTMWAFVSSIDLQLVFDSIDRYHYGPNYVISAYGSFLQSLNNNTSVRGRGIIELSRNELSTLNSNHNPRKRLVSSPTF